MKNKFIWDDHSDQPCQLSDKVYKKAMKKRHRAALLPLVLYNLCFFPLALIVSFLLKGRRQRRENFFALCVNLDKGDQQSALVDDLGCRALQIRLPLADIDNLADYVAFRKKFSQCTVLLNILQNRENIEDKQLLIKNIRLIFTAFSDSVNTFQIGNAINRTKWGFFSVDEYLDFYLQVQIIRDKEFPQLKLVGPAVIDYEYHFTVRALFNRQAVKFDRLSALLYVDRRGAPENTQMGIFDTRRKIDFLYALAVLSRKSSDKILLTEANWPLSNTAPWAPTSESECVSEADYANYLLRYYLLALASNKVEAVYWHQLIAPGYGLVDSREGMRKRSAFYVFKTMLVQLQDVEVESFNIVSGVYRLVCRRADKIIEVVWLNGDQKQPFKTLHSVLNKIGEPVLKDVFISQSPIYLLHD